MPNLTDQSTRHDEDELIVKWSRRVLLAIAVPASYAVAAVLGVVPAMPWSPLG